MAFKEENITLRFTGGGINPRKIKVSELGAILVHFERALKGIIASNNSGLVDEKDYFLTLDDVRSESAGYPLVAHSPNLDFNPALLELDSIIKHKRKNRAINEKTVDSLNRFTGWLRTHSADAELYLNDTLVTTIPKTFLLKEEEYLINEYATIHGEIIDVGKLDPRIEVKLWSGDSLFFPITYDQAIELGKFLFKKITLIGNAKIYPTTFKIHSFKLDDFIIVSDKPYKEKFEKLSGLIGRVWDEIEDPSEYLYLND